MALKEVEAIKDELREISGELTMIDFETPVEPRDDADAETWRDFALDVLDKLSEAEKVVSKAVAQIDA